MVVDLVRLLYPPTVSKFNPLRMSSTQSGNDGNGRPESNPDTLTDEGERSREKN